MRKPDAQSRAVGGPFLIAGALVAGLGGLYAVFFENLAVGIVLIVTAVLAAALAYWALR